MPKKYSKQHQQQAGWGRARQWADWRRSNPSPSELHVQNLLYSLKIDFLVEYEIIHPDGMPQWMDIFIPSLQTAIEVDGSHGWHGYNGSSNKMAAYDELKARYCKAHGIRLCNVKGTITREGLQALLQGGSCADVQEIPF